MNLLTIVSVSGTGGTGYTAYRLTRALHERGHRILLIARSNSLLAQRAREDGVPFDTSLALSPRFRPLVFFREVAHIRRLITERDIQVVHVFHSTEYWLAAAAVLGHRKRPRLVRSRTIPVPIRGHLMNRWLHNHLTDLVIPSAETIYRQYEQLPGFRLDKVRKVYDGVDTKRFHPGKGAGTLRAKLGLDSDAVLVGKVARFAPVKGHEFLVEAAAEVVRKDSRVHFVLVGDGRTMETIRALVRERDLEGHVHFPGRREDVERLLPEMDLYVLTSVGSEGSSRATLEAMAAGLPVIATTVGVLPDIVREGQTGFLIPPRDPERLAERILALAGDEETRREMGQNARNLAVEEFDEERFFDRMEALYEGLCQT